LLAIVDAHARKKTSATQKAKSIIGDAFATASASSFSFSFLPDVSHIRRDDDGDATRGGDRGGERKGERERGDG
jgi:hypothetical protein